MKVWARINHVGWVHFWRSAEAYEAAEPSAHFVHGRTDPRWLEARLTEAERRDLAAGKLTEIEDPGYFEAEVDGA
jgi:hypothetical protein